MNYLIYLLVQIEAVPGVGGYLSNGVVLSIAIFLVGYLLNRKLNDIDKTLGRHSGRLNSIEITMESIKASQKSLESYEKEHREMNRVLNQITVKLNLLNQL